MNKDLNFLFVVVLVIMAIFPLHGQENSITGEVIDKYNNKIVMAEIVLRSQKDSILVRGTTTNDRGKFAIDNIDNGMYILQIHYLGFRTYSRNIELSGASLSLSNIVLEESPEVLNEVTVIGKQPLIQKEINKTRVNIENSIYGKGENSYRLFNVIPEVQADNMGNITFRGQEKVTVYIDSRKIEMEGEYLMNYLKSIPSESIKSIEISSIPSSEFDAANMGAIINIITKKEYQYGLSGSVFGNLQQHRYFQGNGGFFLKHRKRKIIFQSNYSYGRGNGFFDNTEKQYLSNTPVEFNQKEDYREKINAHNAKIGIDYKITDRQTIGANFELNYWNGTTDGQSNITMRNTIDYDIDSIFLTSNEKPLNLKNQNINIFYRNKLDTLGNQLDIGYYYVKYDNHVSSSLNSKFYDENNNPLRTDELLVIDNPLDIDIYTFNTDFNKVFPNKTIFKIGSKFTKSKTKNSISYFEGNGNVINTQRSNDFLYDENIFAFYSNVTKEWEKWGINIGARIENTKYKGESLTSSEFISKNRWDIFPSIFVQYQIAEADIINFSYGRRIIRPSYNLLNPFQDIEDPFFINQGNPELKPYFSNSLEFTYSLKHKYNFTLAYKKATDIISNVYFLNSNSQTISTYENINDENDLLISFNTSIDVNKWWNLSIYANARYQKIKINGPTEFIREKITPYFWFNNRFKLQDNFFVEMNGNYLGNAFYSIYDLKPQGVINFSLRKSFMENDRLTVSLSIDDPFNVKVIKIDVDEESFNRKIKNILPIRSISLGMSYNFSKGKKNTKREHIEPSNNDEINRLQG